MTKKKAAKKRKREPKRELIVGRAQLARLMGVPPNRVSQLLAEGLPFIEAGRKGRRSQYDAFEALDWWRDYQRATEPSPREQRDLEQAALLRLRRQREEARLWPRDEIERAGRAVLETAKARLRRLEHELTRNGIVPPAGRELVRQAVDEALRELARLPRLTEAR